MSVLNDKNYNLACLYDYVRISSDNFIPDFSFESLSKVSETAAKITDYIKNHRTIFSHALSLALYRAVNERNLFMIDEIFKQPGLSKESAFNAMKIAIRSGDKDMIVKIFKLLYLQHPLLVYQK